LLKNICYNFNYLSSGLVFKQLKYYRIDCFVRSLLWKFLNIIQKSRKEEIMSDRVIIYGKSG